MVGILTVFVVVFNIYCWLFNIQAMTMTCAIIDGVAKSPPHGVAAVLQDLDIPMYAFAFEKPLRRGTKFLLSHLIHFCEYLIIGAIANGQINPR